MNAVTFAVVHGDALYAYTLHNNYVVKLRHTPRQTTAQGTIYRDDDAANTAFIALAEKADREGWELIKAPYPRDLSMWAHHAIADVCSLSRLPDEPENRDRVRRMLLGEV